MLYRQLDKQHSGSDENDQVYEVILQCHKESGNEAGRLALHVFIRAAIQ